MEAGVRTGKGKKPIDNWHIPKLEFLQSVVPNIQANGAPIQWSADITEHAHITEIKNPARSSNNQAYESQICRHLDHTDKDTLDNQYISSTTTLLEHIQPVSNLSGPSRVARNYFREAEKLLEGADLNAPHPFRTFTNSHTAFNLTRHPAFKQM